MTAQHKLPGGESKGRPAFVRLTPGRKAAAPERQKKDEGMEESKRIALIGIIVEEGASVEKMNALLHEYRQNIIGRMGIPRPEEQLSIISIAMKADSNTISALSGKLGALPGVSTKTIYAKQKASGRAD